MFDEITSELKFLEKEKTIKILYAVESGSRAWGFASENSDWDVRFIYVHNIDWYLSIEDKKDNLETILPNNIDLAGWELRKALLLFRKSNPPLLEWLRSPIVYEERGKTADFLRKAVLDYFNPKSCLYHYYHMARGNWEAYFKTQEVRVKKYFYVLRPILACMWIESKTEVVPMEFDILMEAGIDDANLKSQIVLLLDRKEKGEELDMGNRIGLIDSFLIEKLNYYNELLKSYQFKNAPGFESLNKIFRDSLKEAWI